VRTGFRTWEQDSDHASIVSCFKLVGRLGVDGMMRRGDCISPMKWTGDRLLILTTSGYGLMTETDCSHLLERTLVMKSILIDALSNMGLLTIRMDLPGYQR